MRDTRRLLWCGLILVGLISFPAISEAQRRVGESIPNSWQDDAELNDVCFVDSQHGWVVGEHGTILRTDDGGKTWRYCSMLVAMSPDQGQASLQMKQMLENIRKKTGEAPARQKIHQSLDVRLESVSFADAKNGVAVGGFFSAGTQISRGSAFRTTDGGANWDPILSAIIPKLNHVELLGRASGWALGNRSFVLGTGIVTTNDGGSNWFSEPNGIAGDWCGGSKTTTGWVLLNRAGEIYVANSGSLERSVSIGGATGRVNQLLMLDDTTGFAVGDQGTFLLTNDGGLSWRVAATEIDQVRLRSFDFRAISKTPTNKICIAGNPGTFVFQFDPATREISAARTPTKCKINSLQMLDEHFGCAVGLQGTILVSRDGGQSWELSRGGNAGVALLAVCFEPNSLPLEAIARTTLGDGYLSAVARFSLGNAEENAEIAVQAASRLGTNDVRFHDARLGKNQFDEAQRMAILFRLVGLIREFEPRAIVVDAASVSLPNGQRVDMFPLLEEAIQMAAEPNQFPEQLAATGMVPWKVERLAIPTEFDDGEWRIDRGSVLQQSGKRLEDEIAISRVLIGLPITCSGVAGYHVKTFSTRDAEVHNNIMAGLDSGQAIPRRRDSKLGSRNLRDIGRTMEKSQSMKQISSLPLATVGDKILWERNLQIWLQDTDRETAGIWLAQLAETYFAKGNLHAASSTLDYLLSQYHDHPLTTVSLATLAGFVASGEVQIASQAEEESFRERVAVKKQADPAAPEILIKDLAQGPVKTTVWTPNPKAPEVVEETKPSQPTDKELGSAFAQGTDDNSTRVEPASHSVAIKKVFWSNAIQQFARFRQRDPELSNHPTMRAFEAHVIRNGDSALQADNLYRQLSLDESAPQTIRHWAANELLIHSKSASSKPQAVSCQTMTTRPRLDGDLDDDAWREITSSRMMCPTRLAPDAPLDDGDQVLLGHDEDFLFVALSCRKMPGLIYAEPTRGRTRNPSLEMFDRVEISFDVDRDCCWPLRLTVDSRGWASDLCGNCAGWDPNWFVAAKHTESHWTIEAAIPWTALGGSPSVSDRDSKEEKNDDAKNASETKSPSVLWNLGLARRLPRKTENIWSQPSPQLKTGFLKFPTISGEEFQALQFK